jgi:hypothetical protein
MNISPARAHSLTDSTLSASITSTPRLQPRSDLRRFGVHQHPTKFDSTYAHVHRKIMALHNAAPVLQFVQQHPGFVALSIHSIFAPLLGLWHHSTGTYPAHDHLLTQSDACIFLIHEDFKHIPSPNIPPNLIFNHLPMCAAAPYTISKPHVIPNLDITTKANSLQSSMIAIIIAIVVVFLLIAGYTW